MGHDAVHFASWLDTYQLAWSRGGSTEGIVCPRCGHCCLVLALTELPDAGERASVYFWCGSCLYGLLPNTTFAAPGMTVVPRASIDIPDYRLVPPE